MPYDANALAALKVVSSAIAAYQSRIAGVAERIAAYLAADDDVPAAGHEAQQLGQFAAGRIDIERFSALWDARDALDQLERGVLTRCHETLREIATRPHEQFIIGLPPGGRLTAAFTNVFADLGRSFGAMVMAELLRTRRFTGDDMELLHGFPRFRWTRAERAMSPPVIVTLDGADLWAGEAAQYLDGNQKIILIVRSPAPPAALVRLITPGTLVLQTCSVDGLAPVVAAEGPAIGALMPAGSAEFVHTPRNAPLHERLIVTSKPQGARKNVEGWTTWQQQQELEQLYALAAAPTVVQPAQKSEEDKPDAATRLAAWLLSHAEPDSVVTSSATGRPV